MGMASHLGPWLLGTVKNTTGTTAGLIRNMGATHSYQNKVIAATDQTAQTTIAVLPAGALIQSIQILVTTAYATTTPTFAFFVNGTAINAATAAGITFGNTGRATFSLGSTGASLVANVGSTDAVVSFTQTTVTGSTGAAILEISYIVRNSDGTYTPTSSQA
jgi:hypothetical protein